MSCLLRLLAIWCLLVSVGDSPGAKPPNLLLILGDDLSFHDLGCWGNPQVHTPNLDRLAGEGLKLTGCFAPAPMCSPLRQALYTGIYPVRNGAYPNHSRVKPGTKSLPHFLPPLGYRVGLVGKAHFGPPECFPFEYPARAPDTNGVPVEKLASLDLSACERFIRRDPQQPFCLVATSNEPHSPWNAGDSARWDAARLKLPPYLVDTPETRTALAAYYAEIAVLDTQVGRLLEMLDRSGQTTNTLVWFISEQGSSFAHSKWTLYEPGIRGALIARWPGRIPPGTTTDALASYVDILPTLLEIAGAKPGPELDGRSLLGVLTGRTNRHRDFIFAEQTSRGIINGPEAYGIRCVRDARYKYILNLNSEAEFSNEASGPKNVVFNSWRQLAANDAFARAQVQRYLRRPAVELYDLENDPWETTNLADRPAQQERLRRMRSQLDGWMQQQGDLGAETERRAKERQGKGKAEE